MIHSDAEFDVNSNVAIKYGLNLWFDWFTDIQSQKAYQKRTKEEKGGVISDEARRLDKLADQRRSFGRFSTNWKKAKITISCLNTPKFSASSHAFCSLVFWKTKHLWLKDDKLNNRTLMETPYLSETKVSLTRGT